LRRGPIEDHLVALLRAREEFGALLHALDRRQGRPAFTTAGCGKDNDRD
jgi:hypothetical protein